MRVEEHMDLTCPYCSAQQMAVIDLSGGDQEYIEDCRVCCRPMTLVIHIGESKVDLQIKRDDDI